MNRDRETGAHRDMRIPWRIRLRCWLFGHLPERVGDHAHCLRCDRNARTPVELP